MLGRLRLEGVVAGHLRGDQVEPRLRDAAEARGAVPLDDSDYDITYRYKTCVLSVTDSSTMA